MIRRLRLAAIILLAPLSAGACQTASTQEPATLNAGDEATLSRIKATLSEAVGRAQIKLGPEDLATSTTISVLPPPLGPNETHSTAMPTVFDIVTNGKSCFAIRRETGNSYRLDGVSCTAVSG